MFVCLLLLLLLVVIVGVVVAVVVVVVVVVIIVIILFFLLRYKDAGCTSLYYLRCIKRPLKGRKVVGWNSSLSSELITPFPKKRI